MLSEDRQLDNIIRWRRNAIHKRQASRLDMVVERYIQRRVLPLENKYASIADVFGELVGAEIHSHCKLSGVFGGQLKVLVDSPVYLYQMRLCSPALLEQFTQLCPKARIKNIRFVIGSIT